MLDALSLVSGLRRPRTLVQAARMGLDHYSRERDLPRTLHCPAAPRPGEALVELASVEAEMNAARLEGANHYSIVRHLDVLTAIMSEAQTLRATRAARPDPT